MRFKASLVTVASCASVLSVLGAQPAQAVTCKAGTTLTGSVTGVTWKSCLTTGKEPYVVFTNTTVYSVVIDWALYGLKSGGAEPCSKGRGAISGKGTWAHWCPAKSYFTGARAFAIRV